MAGERKKHPPTTNWEIYGWYIYDWADGPYSVCGITTFFAPFITLLCKQAADGDNLVYPLGMPVSYASFYSYCVGISVCFQLVAFLLCSVVADHSHYRKKLLLGFTITGSLLTASFWFCTSGSAYWIAGLLFIFSNVCLGVCTIFYNAFLPVILRSHPQIVDAKQQLDTAAQAIQLKQAPFTPAPLSGPSSEAQTASATSSNSKPTILINEHDREPNLQLVAAEHEYHQVLARLNNQLSTHGYTVSTAGSVLCLVLNIGLFFIVPNEVLAYRINLAVIGLWWITFSIPTFVLLHPRPSAPLPRGTGYLTYTFRRIRRTFSLAKQLPMTFRFLSAYFIYSDGISTVGYAAALLATQEIGMSASLLGLAVLGSYAAAIAGNVAVYAMATRWPTALTQKRLLLFSLLLLGAIPVWAVPAMTSSGEFFAAAAVFGVGFLSAISISRGVYAHLVPAQREAEFFALFEVTDKGTAWLGPVAMGVLTQLTGSLRWGVAFIVTFIATGAVILLFVDIERGRRDVAAFNERALANGEEAHGEEEEEKKKSGGGRTVEMKKESQKHRPYRMIAEERAILLQSQTAVVGDEGGGCVVGEVQGAENAQGSDATMQ